MSKSEQIRLRVTRSQKRTFERAAKDAKRSLSSWLVFVAEAHIESGVTAGKPRQS